MDLFNSTKIASYFIWEYTRCDIAMNMWYCAEDTANYFERGGYTDKQLVRQIVMLDPNHAQYIDFIRHIAFRLYIYTNRADELSNWLDAEKLARCGEWLDAIIDMAVIFSTQKAILSGIKSDYIRNCYK